MGYTQNLWITLWIKAGIRLLSVRFYYSFKDFQEKNQNN